MNGSPLVWSTMVGGSTAKESPECVARPLAIAIITVDPIMYVLHSRFAKNAPRPCHLRRQSNRTTLQEEEKVENKGISLS